MLRRALLTACCALLVLPSFGQSLETRLARFVADHPDHMLRLPPAVSADFSQQDDGATILGRWAYGPCLATAVHGSTAYFGNGGYFVAADVSDPNTPVELGRLELPSYVADIALEGSIAFVAAYGGGLRILDVANPAQPMEISNLATPGLTISVAAQGDTVLVADFNNVYALDVSDPAQPVVRSSFRGEEGIPVSVAIRSPFAFVADYAGIRVFDLTDWENPVELGFYESEAFPIDLALDGDLAIVSEPPAGVRILDLSNPRIPRRRGLLPLGSILGVGIEGTTGYVASGNRTLYVLDLADPINPVEAQRATLPGFVQAITPQNGMVFAASTHGGFQVLDATDPLNPQVLGSLPTTGAIDAIAVEGAWAYLGESGGLRVIDVSLPDQPEEVAFYPASQVRGVRLADNRAYLAFNGGLIVLDMTTPQAPQELSVLDYNGIGADIALDGSLLFLADLFRNVQVVDVEDPQNPQRIGGVRPPDSANDIALGNDHAYIALDRSGVQVVDVSTPTQPLEVGALISDGARGVALAGTTLFVADLFAGLVVMDVTNPADPFIQKRLPLPGGTNDVTLADGLAHVASQEGGLRLVDIPDAESAQEVGFAFAGNDVRDVAVQNRTAYLAGGNAGLYIARVDVAGTGTATEDLITPSLLLESAYPNPFSTQTTLRVTLPHASPVQAEVFDALGRRVRTLHRGFQAAGAHDLSWDGHDDAGIRVPSGRYFVRFSTPKHLSTTSVLLLPRD